MKTKIILTAWLFLTTSLITKAQELDSRVVKNRVIKAKVFLYNIDQSYSSSEILISEIQLNSSIIEEKEISTYLIKKIQEITHSNESYLPNRVPAPPASCFYPRHGIVFFDEMNEIVEALSICFACNRMVVFPRRDIENIYAVELIKEELEKMRFPIFDSLEEYLKYKETKL